MLMSDGPWSPEHIYQEIVGYGKTWHRGEHSICITRVGLELLGQLKRDCFEKKSVNLVFLLLGLREAPPKKYLDLSRQMDSEWLNAQIGI